MREQTYTFGDDGVLRRVTVETIPTCENGHTFTPDTFRIRSGGERQPRRLVCLTCERERGRAYQDRKRGRSCK